MVAPATMDPGPSVPTRVRPADFQHVGQQFADAQDRVEEIGSGLRSALSALVGAAGNDASGRSFGTSYQPAADAAFAGVARLVGLLGSIGAGLGRSAENHRRGDADSVRGGDGGPLFPPIAVRAAPTAAGAPLIVGEGESPVPDWAAQYWPNGDPDRMQDAGRAWQRAADAVEGLAAELHTALTTLIRDSDGEDVRELGRFWDRVGGASDSALLVVLPRVCRAISDGCWQWGFAIRDAHTAMMAVIEEALISLAAITAAAVLLTPFTFGGSDVAGAAGDAAVIASAVARLSALAATLLGTVGGALAVAGVVEGAGAIRAAIDATPDPRAVEIDTVRVGDGIGRGTIDESAKVFSPQERVIADRLAADGHDVKSVPESTVENERSPDALVDGVATEFKTADAGAVRDSGWVRNVLNDSKRDGGQARRIILNAEDTSLSAEDAHRGIARFLGARPGHFDSIIIWTSAGAVTWP